MIPLSLSLLQFRKELPSLLLTACFFYILWKYKVWMIFNSVIWLLQLNQPAGQQATRIDKEANLSFLETEVSMK